MKNNVALYIGADPLTYNDLDIIKKSVSLFDYVHIILDRKNRDAEYAEYYLSYTDRSEIIKHELKENHIDSYDIIPIDETVQKTLHDNSINTLILNLDYQKNISFRMMNVLQQMVPNVNIITLRGKNFIEGRFIKTIMDSDSTIALHRQYCSDYSFYKFKIRNVRKVAITSNSDDIEEFIPLFEERGYNVTNLDIYKQKDIKNELANGIINATTNDFVVKLSEKNLMKDDFYKTFDDIIFIETNDDILMDKDTKDYHESVKEISDFIISGERNTIRNELIRLINRRRRRKI